MSEASETLAALHDELRGTLSLVATAIDKDRDLAKRLLREHVPEVLAAIRTAEPYIGDGEPEADPLAGLIA